MNSVTLLSRSDVLGVLDFCNEAIKVQTEAQLKNLAVSLKALFPFDYTFCSYLNTQAFTSLKSNMKMDLLDINYPEGVLHTYLKHSIYRQDPVAREFAKSFQVQNWQDCFEKYVGIGLIEPLKDIGVVDGFTHGTMGPGTCSVFSFACCNRDDTERTKTILNYVIPHLGEALRRILGDERIQSHRLSHLLTDREQEILNWLKQGKSSWEISAILNISERTANFHVNNIMGKLKASNRAHAVAIAYSKGVIEL